MFGVLTLKYPQYNIIFMMDQSSDHGKLRYRSLSANWMSVHLRDDFVRNTIDFQVSQK